MAEILVGEYLFRRVKELGVQSVFGVPGDYELALLDLVPQEGLKWHGTPNELIGAYAADGYARIAGAGALVTTFGPGELSALCGIGGSFCEFIPVLHIVGYPAVKAQKSGKILHHTLGDKSYDHYVKMSSELCAAAVVLKDPATAAADIDRVINAMLYHSQPGYIGIPPDIAYAKISSEQLKVPLIRALEPNNPESEATVLNEILKRLEECKSPVIIADGGANVFSWKEFANDLVEALEVPTFSSTIGKSIVKETNPLFGGVFVGSGSTPHVQETIEQSDCILWLGNYPSDFNTGVFTEKFNPEAVIDLQRFYTMIGHARYEVKITHLLPKLIDAIKSNPKLHKRGSSLKVAARSAVKAPTAGHITHDWFWQRTTPMFKAGDLIVTETGTSQFGINDAWLPEGASLFTQAIYGSIGYAIGAAVGASIASKETGKYKRMIVFTGEGSLQLTVQSFALLNRHGVVPLVFVVNNDGYTVERYLHGMHAEYNRVPAWNYTALFKDFAPEVAPHIKTYKVDLAAEVDQLLDSQEFNNAEYPQLVELIMDPEDAPLAIKKVGEI